MSTSRPSSTGGASRTGVGSASDKSARARATRSSSSLETTTAGVGAASTGADDRPTAAICDSSSAATRDACSDKAFARAKKGIKFLVDLLGRGRVLDLGLAAHQARAPLDGVEGVVGLFLLRWEHSSPVCKTTSESGAR